MYKAYRPDLLIESQQIKHAGADNFRKSYLFLFSFENCCSITISAVIAGLYVFVGGTDIQYN